MQHSAALSQEIHQIAASLHSGYPPALLEIACTSHLAQSLMRQFATSNNTDLSRMTDMLGRMTASYAKEQGIPPAEVQQALMHIQQASFTVDELDRIDRLN